ncbi:MAG: UDP-N-acetylmuramyl-tripeptide synthetase [Singulisphaera sp.]|nr:UDP-N-acetylmuramyl-tripeptide synthetase [Singulisphaera sp.]
MARWFVDRLPQRGIPSVSLRKLLPGARFVGCRDWEVSGCTADSRRLDPGQVFVAIRGSRHDGHDFVSQALERGAAGVVVERPCPEAGRLQVVVADSRVAHARICQALAGDPTEQLLTVGVTGTCGKTVASLLLRSIFEATGERFGLVGALGWSDGVDVHPSSGVSPGAEGLAAMLGTMVECRCAGAVIEVGAEALEQCRIEGLELDAAVVTDLGGTLGPGLDDLPARRRAKARLFCKVVPGGAAVVNADDPYAELLGAVNLDARRVSFAIDRPADVTARIVRLDARGSRFLLRGFDREAAVELPLVGPAHVSQALAAAAVAWSRDLMLDAVVAGLESVTGVPGRLEAVVEGQDFAVWVDQARSGLELWQALASVRALTSGKVHCVLGAEGLQGRSVRLALAHAAEAGADRVVLTSDNPRTEDPNQILDDLLSGFRRPGRVRVEPDRRRAIEAALRDAEPGDAVLIAGKGQRTFQIFAGTAVPFDDQAIAAQWLRRRYRNPNRSSA